jgi:hypothetical protein
MEKYIWSLDVSTTNLGSALWDKEGKLIELKHLELKLNKEINVDDRDICKADLFRKYCLDYKKRIENEFNGEISNIIIEEPIGGSMNAFTVAMLFSFNGMCRYILYDVFGIIPMKISVHESRKLFLPEFVHTKREKGKIVEVLSFPDEWKKDKKEYIRQKVSVLEPHIEWFYDKNNKIKDTSFDMSDSYCVGHAGLRLLRIIK